jgi:hypothetical protein
MSRSRPTSNPLSYHQPTGQYYVTRGRKRVYLGADLETALVKFHRMHLGMTAPWEKAVNASPITLKELSNRFLTTQRANWRNPKETMKGYLGWLGRFLKDHPHLLAQDFTVEMFADWKISLKERHYSLQSINHYLSAVRALFRFAEDTERLEKSPRLNRVKNESSIGATASNKPIYSSDEISTLLQFRRKSVPLPPTQLQKRVILAEILWMCRSFIPPLPPPRFCSALYILGFVVGQKHYIPSRRHVLFTCQTNLSWTRVMYFNKRNS